MEVITYEERLAGREARRIAMAKVAATLGPYKRERPRDPEKAALLRKSGTPERLIGPIGTTERRSQ
jgi:hypothetical protein